MNGPSSAEALVLHDALDGDEQAAKARLREFTSTELAELAAAGRRLNDWCLTILIARR